MNATLIAETGAGGHRHLHTRFLVEYVYRHRREMLQALWFFVPTALVETIVASLSREESAAFRSRVVPGEPCGGAAGLHGVLSAAEGVRATHVVFLEIDEFVYALTTAHLSARVSGVWFRPSFHYSPMGLLHEGLRQRLLGTAKRAVARILCKREAIHQIFVFDEWAADYASRRIHPTKIRHIPDPLAFSSLVPANSAVSSERFVFGIIGAISRRKGVFSALAALERLTPEAQHKVELRIVGRCALPGRQALIEAIERARQNSKATIVHVDEFVTDERIDEEIVGADVLVLTYQAFVGSSGVLIRAALHGIPVLATRYGLVGAQVNRYGLGVTVDPFDEKGTARAMEAFVHGEWPVYNHEAAKSFAAAHSPERYCERVLDLILVDNLGCIS
jgi:glycosyltransferase involved in cell wall biosynthesis